MIGLLLIISTSVINAQETTTEKETKTITYEEMKSISMPKHIASVEIKVFAKYQLLTL